MGTPVSAADLLLPAAAEKSDYATIRTLLKQRADVNSAQPDGMTALHWAAHRDDLAKRPRHSSRRRRMWG